MNNLAKMEPRDTWHLRPGQTLDDLRASMPPASAKDLSVAVSMLFAGLKSKNGSDTDNAMALRIYLSALESWPFEAVQAAVSAFVSGKVERDEKDRNFVPAVPELLREVRNQFNARVRTDGPSADDAIQAVSNRYWANRQRALRRREAIIQGYRESYKIAVKTDPKLTYVQHICNEHKRATGRELKITKPVNHD